MAGNLRGSDGKFKSQSGGGSSSSGVSFEWNDKEFLARLAALPAYVDARLRAGLNYHGDRMVASAKANAKWTDRTGNARAGIEKDVQANGKNYSVNIHHTVPYGIWLEVRWSGRYAIILPTVQAELPALRKTISLILGP